MISKLRAPDKDIDRAIRNIYDKLNELIDAVNSPATTEGNNSSTEKIRLVKLANGTRRIEFNFGDEWYKTKDGTLEAKDN